MEDIYFYDFDFELLYILPPYSQKGGYISINCDVDFNGTGTAEILFYDTELKALIKRKPQQIFFRWGSFYGFITSYEFKPNACRIMGMHLNGLLHRIVFAPINEKKDTCLNFVSNAMADVTWVYVIPNTGSWKNNIFYYSTDTYRYADEVIKEIMDKAHGGYRLYADFTNKRFNLSLRKATQTDLLLSEKNLNAYNFVTDFNGKDYANVGYYKDADEIWHVTTTKNKGIYKVECVLSSNNESAALEELAKKTADFSISAEVKTLEYGNDYDVGDLVKIEYDGGVDTKIIKSVNVSCDGGYSAVPTFESWEE